LAIQEEALLTPTALNELGHVKIRKVEQTVGGVAHRARDVANAVERW